MPTNQNNNDDSNIYWEPSTTNRDNLKEPSPALETTINAVNHAIRTFDNSVGWTARQFGFDVKFSEISANDVTSGTGGTFVLRALEEGIKLARRGINIIDKAIPWPFSIATGAMSLAIEGLELTVDRLKDLMIEGAISGLAADIGDLKEGQAKLNAKVDAQGKALTNKMNNIKSELEGQLKKQGEELDEKIKNASGEAKKDLQRAKEELKAQIEGVQSNLD